MFTIILISLFVTSTANAAPWVPVGMGCNHGKNSYDTKAQCELVEPACEDYGAKVAACKTAIINERQAKFDKKMADHKKLKDDWQTLSTQQKIELIRDLLL